MFVIDIGRTMKTIFYLIFFNLFILLCARAMRSFRIRKCVSGETFRLQVAMFNCWIVDDWLRFLNYFFINLIRIWFGLFEY